MFVYLTAHSPKRKARLDYALQAKIPSLSPITDPLIKSKKNGPAIPRQLASAQYHNPPPPHLGSARSLDDRRRQQAQPP